MAGANIDNDDITLIRGETLSIDVYLTFDSGEPVTHEQVPVNKIVAQAWFQNGERITFTVTELEEESCWNLFSDIDTSKIKGDSFLVNVGIKPLSEDAPDNINICSMNQTFYLINSATLPNVIPPEPPQPVAGGHSVVYYLDKEYYTCQNYDEGDTIIPPTPTETGYTFTGWTGLPSPLIMPDRCLVANGKMVSPASLGLEFDLRDINGGTILPPVQAYLLGRGECMDTAVVIPEIYNGLPVTRIALFRNDQNLLRELVVPESVTDIDAGTFYNNFTLQKVILPETQIHLHGACFSGCQSLNSINLSENCIFEANVFEVCKSLKNLDLPLNMTEIPNYFLQQSGIENIIIPPRVVRIGYHSFLSCENLKTIRIPLSVVQIYAGAFLNCSSLTDVYYEGTQEQWNAIQISPSNEPLENANIHYGGYNQ